MPDRAALGGVVRSTKGGVSITSRDPEMAVRVVSFSQTLNGHLRWMGGRRYYASLLSRGPIATLVPFVPFYPYRHRGRAVRSGSICSPEQADRGGRHMSAESRPFSLLPRSRAFEPRSVSTTRPTPPTPATESAGGAVGIVAAGGFGSDWAWGEGAVHCEQTSSHWRSRARNGVHGLSGRTGRRERYGVGQIRANLSNAPTLECECMSMYGIEGRVVPGAIAVAGYSVSSARKLNSLRVGEPARGVMGGLLQPTTPSVEPPVSSLNGSHQTPTTTAPAPIGVLAGVVSPRTSAAGAAVGAEPAGRMSVKKMAA